MRYINLLLKNIEKNKEKTLEEKIELTPQKYSKPSYLKYIKGNPFDEALKTGIDPITGAKIERQYFFMFEPGVLGYFEPHRKTITLPYSFEVGHSTLYETLAHEIAHSKGSVDEPNTEADGLRMLNEYLK
jgi:hypothetical protein